MAESTATGNNEHSAAEVLLRRLKMLGVDYLFANAGTDFPPLIEALAAGTASSRALPQPLVIPHESVAMGMAHGFYLATGRPQAVMVHTNVGLANAAIGTINASTDRVPILLFSGRTPATEKGHLGSRTTPIGWGQEMRDQTALVRETTKWDYELRFPEQVVDLIDRAFAIAMSTPRGPIYLSLPREVLAAPCAADLLQRQPTQIAVSVEPPDLELERAAACLAAAKRPLVIAQRGAGGEAGVLALTRLVEEWHIPVVQFWPGKLALATDHPMMVGQDPTAWLHDRDVILVIDALTPWLPHLAEPPKDCTIIQLGPDPLFERFPVRGFRADIALRGDVAPALIALAAAMDCHLANRPASSLERRSHIIEAASESRALAAKGAKAGAGRPMSKAWVSRCVGDIVCAHAGVAVSELGIDIGFMPGLGPDNLHREPPAGGLGWGFPAALGLQLADRQRLVVACLGDGSYMFANPVACHLVAEALSLPLLIVLFNNASWNAVRRATLDLYPDGYAARSNAMPLTDLTPSPDFVQIAKASRAFAERVDDGAELKAALERAVEVTQTERRLALIEAIVDV